MIAFLRDLILRDFWIKLFSLGLAILIWEIIAPAAYKPAPASSSPAGRASEMQTNYTIPVLVMSSAADVRSFKVDPSEVEVRVRGEARRLRELQAKDIRALVDLTGIESARDFRKQIEVTTPAGITFLNVVPEQVEVIVPSKP